jgi:hypothetical protein
MAKRPSYDPRNHSARSRSLAAAMHQFGSDGDPVTADEVKELLMRACDEQRDGPDPDKRVVMPLLAAYVAVRDAEHEDEEDEEGCPVLPGTEAEQLYRTQYALGYKTATKVAPDPEDAWFPDCLDWKATRRYPADVVAELGFTQGNQAGKEAIYLRENYTKLQANFEAKYGKKGGTA